MAKTKEQKITRTLFWINIGYGILGLEFYQMIESVFWKHDFKFGIAYLINSLIWTAFIEVRFNTLNKLKFEVTK